MATRGCPGARPGPRPLRGHIPACALPAPAQSPFSTSTRPPRVCANSRSSPGTCPACALDPLFLSPVRTPTCLPFPARFPRSLPSRLPPPLPRAPYQAEQARTEVLGGDSGGIGDCAPDLGVSALSTPRPLRAGTPKPFPARRSRFCFQIMHLLLQPRPPPSGVNLRPRNRALKRKRFISKIVSYLLLTEHLLA